MKIRQPAQAHERVRFAIDVLRDLAGEKAFERGEAYHRGGHVVIVRIDPTRVVAQVAGTQDYRTELTGRGRKIDGKCSCPAFEDWGFCKHMVAAALSANAAGINAEAEGAGTLGRIRTHLKSKGLDGLVEMILVLAERDPALFGKLDLAAMAVDASDDKALRARLRKAIDGATRTQGFVDYREMPGWAEKAEEALLAISELVPAGRPIFALELIDHAIGRITQASDNVDNSDGLCGALLQQAKAFHLAACGAAKPDPAGLARDLFLRETLGDHDTFQGAAALYADVLGEAGLAEYRHLAVEAWEKLPPLAGARRTNHEPSGDYHLLRGILDFFAERDGDVEARIALRAKDLSSPWSYLQLAEFCRAHGRADEALRRAEEGLWVFEDDRPDERLVLFAAALLSKAGRKSDAEAHIWRAFEKEPSSELFTQLRKIGGTPAFELVLKRLEARLADRKLPRLHHCADLLVRILMHEKTFDAAWAAVQQHGASRELKAALAKESEASHPRKALDVYVARVEELAAFGGNHAYAEAAELVGRMSALWSAAEHAAYVVDLKVRLGRKRNFMKLLA